MTIISVIEQDLKGLRTFKSSLSEGHTGQRTFLVITNDPTHVETDVIGTVAQGLGLPAPLDLFPGSSIAMCVDIDPTRNNNDRTKWTVVCQYKSILNQQEIARAAQAVPTSRATAISGQSRTVMRPARRLLRTVPYKLWSEATPGATWGIEAAVNSASDPIDPPIDRAFTEFELHCEKNVAALPSWWLTYGNGVNNADQIISIQGVNYTIPKGWQALQFHVLGCQKRKQRRFYYHRLERHDRDVSRPVRRGNGSIRPVGRGTARRGDAAVRYRLRQVDQHPRHKRPITVPARPVRW